MCKVLADAGTEVVGYALELSTALSLYQLCGEEGKMRSVLGDVRDRRHLQQVFAEVQPEIVIHMVAQPLGKRVL